MRVLLFTLLIGTLVSCSDSSGRNSPAVVGATSSTPMAESGPFLGLIVARNATDLRAPQNSFRIGDWSSDSSWIELKQLAKDGKAVKKGDMVGRFAFSGRRALPRVQERIAEAEAKRERSDVSESQTVDRLDAEVSKNILRAMQAELDVKRGEIVSTRELRTYEINRDLAHFDSEANRRKANAARSARNAELDYLEKNLEKAQADLDRFQMYKTRFTVTAPHDGVVRHAYHRRRRRKVQKGDGMPSGMHFASVAKDATVEVEVYIPESHYELAQSAKTVRVKSVTSDEVYDADVTSIDEFPQTIGFIKRDNDLPNARERVYVVHAAFSQPPDGLSSGLEVKVEVRR